MNRRKTSSLKRSQGRSKAGPDLPVVTQQSQGIPRKTVYRLSIYFRCLGLMEESRDTIVSSSALAAVAGVHPAQLRKDLTH